MPKEGAPVGGMEGGMMDAGAEMPSDTNAAPVEAPAAETSENTEAAE